MLSTKCLNTKISPIPTQAGSSLQLHDENRKPLESLKLQGQHGVLPVYSTICPQWAPAPTIIRPSAVWQLEAQEHDINEGHRRKKENSVVKSGELWWTCLSWWRLNVSILCFSEDVVNVYVLAVGFADYCFGLDLHWHEQARCIRYWLESGVPGCWFGRCFGQRGPCHLRSLFRVSQYQV